MLQVRMKVIGIQTGGETGEIKTAILEPLRDGGNVSVSRVDRIAEGPHISGRLTLTYDTKAAAKIFESRGELLLSLEPVQAATPEQLQAEQPKPPEEPAKND